MLISLGGLKKAMQRETVILVDYSTKRYSTNDFLVFDISKARKLVKYFKPSIWLKEDVLFKVQGNI